VRVILGVAALTAALLWPSVGAALAVAVAVVAALPPPRRRLRTRPHGGTRRWKHEPL